MDTEHGSFTQWNTALLLKMMTSLFLHQIGGTRKCHPQGHKPASKEYSWNILPDNWILD